jgi:NAD(P)-dependent dehydrogenase (short-subunit alcohol dehydrogenase family)
MAAYGATKSALIGLTRTLGAEWARYNIRVNAIAPGYIATDLTAGLLGVPKYVEGIKAATPMGRIGAAEEITGIAVYLASDAASFATGQVFVVDGGISAV